MVFSWSNCAGWFIWFVKGKCFLSRYAGCHMCENRVNAWQSRKLAKLFLWHCTRHLPFGLPRSAVIFLAGHSVPVATNIYQETIIGFHQLYHGNYPDVTVWHENFKFFLRKIGINCFLVSLLLPNLLTNLWCCHNIATRQLVYSVRGIQKTNGSKPCYESRSYLVTNVTQNFGHIAWIPIQ